MIKKTHRPRSETEKINSLTQLRSDAETKNHISWWNDNDEAEKDKTWWKEDDLEVPDPKRQKSELTSDRMTLETAHLANQQESDNIDEYNSMPERTRALERSRRRNDPIYDYITKPKKEKKRQFVDKLKIYLSELFGVDIQDPENRWCSALDKVVESEYNHVFLMLLFYTMSAEDEFMEERIIQPTFSAHGIKEHEQFDARYVKFCNGALSTLAQQQIIGGIVNSRAFVEECIQEYITI